MSIPLTLGLPHRPDPRALVAELLSQRCPTPRAVQDRHLSLTCGPPVVTSSLILAADAGLELGRVIVDLDIDPDELRRPDSSVAQFEAIRFDIDASADVFDEALALRLPSPVVVFPDFDAMNTAYTAQAVAAAHRSPGISADRSPEDFADFLAIMAHTDVGFVARAQTGEEVVAILSATVAALRGNDIKAAFTQPDPAKLAALIPEASEAVRLVLLAIEVDDASSIDQYLASAGLT